MSSDSTPPPPVPPQQAYPPPPAEPRATIPPHPPSPPVAPIDKPKRNVLSIVALVTAALGFLFAVIPGAFALGWILLAVGFVLAIVSFFLPGKKALAILALVLSVIGAIAGGVAFVATLVNAVDDAFGEEVVAAPAAPRATENAPAAEKEETAEPVAQAEDLSVVETAFGRQSYDATNWWYVAVLENPNTDFIFSNTSITVEAVGADGTILDSSSAYTTILSGRIAVAGTFLGIGQSEIAELSVRGPDAASAISSPQAETGAFTIESLTPVTDQYRTSVTGTVSGTFSTEQEFVVVTVVARDAAGAIIGSEQAYVERLPADGGKVQFEATFFDPLPADSSFESFVTF